MASTSLRWLLALLAFKALNVHAFQTEARVDQRSSDAFFQKSVAGPSSTHQSGQPVKKQPQKKIVLAEPGVGGFRAVLLLTVFGSAYSMLGGFLIVAFLVGACLSAQEGSVHERCSLHRSVVSGQHLAAVSQIIYRVWVLICYTLPSCLVFGIPVLMIVVAANHVEEVAIYMFVLTSVSGLAIVLNLAIMGALGISRLQLALSVPPEQSPEQPEQCPEQPKVIHWVVLPQYKESVEIVSQTLNSMCKSSSAKTMGVLLAMEAREAEAEMKAEALSQAFDGKFGDLQVCYHPDDLPNDPPGKASNCTFAFVWLLQYLGLDFKDGRSGDDVDGNDLRRSRALQHQQMLALNPPRLGAETPAMIVLTVGDADSVFHNFYFEELARQFLESRTKKHIWQAPILHVKNFEEAPAPVKVGTIFTSLNELAVHADPNAITFPYSTYSLPLELAREVGGWDPQWISEDWHMGIKCMLLTMGQCTLKKHPLPICNYTPEDETYFGTLRARWIQMRRHAMGFADLAYIFMVLPLLQVATRSPGSSSHAFGSAIAKAVPLLMRIVSVHVTLGLLTVFGALLAILEALELLHFVEAGRLDRIITLGREFQGVMLFAIASAGVLTCGHFARAYQFIMFKLERRRTDAVVDWCRFCFYLLWAGPFFFLATGLCSCLAAIQLLRGPSTEYTVAPKPRLRASIEEYEVCDEIRSMQDGGAA